jgi:hypothetical protein
LYAVGRGPAIADGAARRLRLPSNEPALAKSSERRSSPAARLARPDKGPLPEELCRMIPVFAPRRRRLLLALAGAGLSVGLLAALPGSAAAASIFPFIPDHYTFTLAQGQAAIVRQFPFRRQMAQVFDITLSNPLLGLLPARNRVTIRLDALLSSPFLDRPVNGAFTLSSQLAYDRASRSIVLRSPVLEQIDLGAAAGPYGQQISDGVSVMASQLLDNYPIHTFKPDELSFAGVSYEPGTITILSSGVRVQIVEG